MTLLDLMAKWEPVWLALAFLVSIIFEAFTAYMVLLEYRYDEQKDIEKKQRRTKTTRKTTKGASGESVTEEQIEVTEPVAEEKKNVGN